MSRLQNILGRLLGRLRYSSFVFVYIFLANLFIVYKVNIHLEPLVMKSKFAYIAFCASSALLSAFVLGFVFQFVCNIVNKRVSNVLCWVFTLLYTFVFLFDAYTIELYSSPMTSNIILSVISTNLLETKEYISNLQILLQLKYFLCLVVCALLAWFVEKKCSEYIFKRFFVIKICLVLFYLAFFFPRLNPNYGENGVYYWGMNSLERVVYSYDISRRDLKDIETNVERLKNRKFKYIKSGNSIDSLNIIIIQGESLRRNSMHCYGALADNTPNIDSMIDSGEIVLFRDCVSSGANTAISVPRIFSFYNNYRSGNWLEYPTIINAMRDIGCYTMWVSNQDKGGDHANPITALSMIADSARFTDSSVSVSISSAKRNYDEEILPLLPNLNDAKKKNKSNLFAVVHLMGQHEKFFMRYPKEFDIFKPKTNDKKFAVISEYYNSVLYGDYIISRIINHYKNSDAIVFFTSDHGINMYDDPNSPTSTGHSANKYTSPVPFFVYMSKSFKEKYPDIYDKVIKSKDRPFSNDILSDAISDLFGIKTEYSDDRFKLFSDKYQSPKKRKNIGFNSIIEITKIYDNPDSIKEVIKTK